METTDFISVQLICKHYNIPQDFINRLQEFELIELKMESNDFFIHKTELKRVEKMVRLHYDLDINMEGIDAISNLLDQVDSLKKQITNLNNRLRLYEDF
ncbi:MULTISPECIES: chaperone modulator CbpM [Aestuariibaculum]|uniref:Chaperone modulator CbpM n=1 Tax=Aestuariibaculum lutulentum TaxID=2920935 RepID=A0ABS9RLP9_9FLAO|nr:MULTISPECIES: chaperone modulator CbpM [Aestuariibaculum]MCH4553883.1 chaperone modulator CbpM [Aestuariibaculum lutulentum]MCR8667568.1 chaperone modulator CbpM [Aestuariibaculum sp. M13]